MDSGGIELRVSRISAANEFSSNGLCPLVIISSSNVTLRRFLSMRTSCVWALVMLNEVVSRRGVEAVAERVWGVGDEYELEKERFLPSRDGVSVTPCDGTTYESEIDRVGDARTVSKVAKMPFAWFSSVLTAADRTGDRNGLGLWGLVVVC